MNRRLTLFFAAAEALIVLGVGLAIPLAITTLLWAAHFGFAPEWTVFWRAAADVWLLGHGVDVTFVLDPELAASLGLAGAAAPVTVTVAILGFALLTFALAIRAGRRSAESGHPLLAGVAVVVVFALGSLAVVLLSLHDHARASITQSAILPALVFGLGVAIGLVTARDRRDRPVAALRRLGERVPPGLAAGAGVTLRVGVGGAVGVLGLGAAATVLAVVLGYANLISLYEALQAGPLGGAVLTVVQLALLPVIVVWAAAWVLGPGFAVGVGSTVSPFATAVGPIPPIPILGALPASTPPAAFLALVLPVVLGFLLGTLAARRAPASLGLGWRALAGLAGGAVAGLVLGLLAAAASGSAGPGRLAVVGPDPLAVGIWAAVEIGVPAALALLSTRPR